MSENKMTEQESLLLIHQMINKAKNSYHDTGIGPILWGSVITFCSLVTYCRVQFGFKLPFDIWFLTLIAIVPQIFIAIKEGRINKAKHYDDKVFDYVWISFGIAIFLLTFINANVIEKLNPVFQVYIDVKGGRPSFDYGSFMGSFFLMLYGIPTFITGAGRNFKPMLLGGIICWVCCIVSVYTKFKIDMLLTAFAATMAWLIPGIILWVKYQKKLKANV
jgi:hypothetical protein